MSLTPDWFARRYDDVDDPWGLEGGWYEERKRALVAAALPEPRFRRAFEPGCANGALSELLAPRCDELLCWDTAEPAVARTRARLAGHPGVTVARADVPTDVPPGRFDLVVVSEIAYYFDRADRDALWALVQAALEPGGILVAVHWTRAAPEHPVLGGPVHDELLARPGLAPLALHIEADFRLDVLVAGPAPAPSVAERTGLRRPGEA